MRMIAVFTMLSLWLCIASSGNTGLAEQKGEQVGEKKSENGEKPNDAEKPEPVTFKDKITKTDPFDSVRKKCHRKVHMVKLIPGYQYLIHMKAKFDKKEEFDTYLRLEDDQGKQVAENDDYITTDSRIAYEPKKPGMFRVVATTFDPGFTGSYTVTVTPVKIGAGGIVGGVLKIKGQITAADPFYPRRPNSRHKVHKLKMIPGKTYIIDLQARFDTYLFLEDSKGNVLTRDDDGGMGLNSKIVYSPQKADDYRIIVTTYGQRVTGPYTLVVTAK